MLCCTPSFSNVPNAVTVDGSVGSRAGTSADLASLSLHDMQQSVTIIARIAIRRGYVLKMPVQERVRISCALQKTLLAHGDARLRVARRR